MQNQASPEQVIKQPFRRDLQRGMLSPPTGPPPAPPPPPPVLSSTPVLSPSRWTPSNSDRETRTTVPAPSQSAAPGLDAQTLQHVAAGLRKTQYNKPLRGDETSVSDGRMDRENVRMPGRDWENSAINEPVERNPTREAFHASSAGTREPVPFSNYSRYTDSLSNPGQQRSPQPYSSTYTQYSAYQQKRSTNDGVGSNDPYYITDPKAKIREYATKTTVYSSSTPSKPASQLYEEHIRQTSPSYNKPSKPNDFVRELRDQGLTRTQRIANQFQQPTVREVEPPPSLGNIYKQKERMGTDKIDEMIRDMEWKMKTGFSADDENTCFACNEPIAEGRPGCKALDRTYHISCFQCKECGKQLAGSSFYNVDGKPLCENDYKNTLERCASCGEVIMERLLRASGSAYHPHCFVCTICKKSLDSVPYTVDSSNQVHCIPCFQDKFAPRCAVCSKPIIPEEGEKESVRIVAMDKSFHVNCYRCEDCNVQLSSKLEGEGCYPLDQHLYCKNCSGKRLVALSKAA